MRAHPWWFVGVALVIFSYLLVHHAGTRPGYDPYGWLIWGYQTLHLGLDLGGAPSWKPLPYLFTVPLSLVGSHALTLWMTFSTAVSLSGSIFAGRIVYRIMVPRASAGPAPRCNGATTGPSAAAVDVPASRRWAAAAAGVFAGLALLGLNQWMHILLSSQSDTMIVAICLAAIDCHLSGHHRWAFAFLVLAALGRPESWPFTGLYAIWAWRAIPSMRKFLVAGIALIPILWFGVPTITNARPFVSAELAELSVRRIVGNKFLGVFHRYTALTYLPVQLLALLAVIVAALRRNRTVLVLAGAAVLWMVVEMAFVLHGWPGVPRYMLESAGVQCVLAGVALGWIITDLPRLRLRRVRGSGSGGGGGLRAPSWIGVPLAALIVISLVPGALARVRAERKDLTHERARTMQITRLDRAISLLGGYRHIRDCGRPTTYVGFVSILAYFTHMNVGNVGHKPQFEERQSYPVILFSEGPHGWSLQPWHLRPATRASCSRLRAKVLFDARHPGGRVVRL